MNTVAIPANDFSLSNLGSLFIPERVEMMKFMVGGMAIGAATFGSLWYGLPEIAVASDAIGRTAQVMAMAALVSAVVMLNVFGCFRLFDTEHAMNPLAQAESVRYRVTNRVLVNTVEQAVIFLPPMIALGFLLDGASFRLLPALVGTWVISRLVFWVSYQVYAPSRGLGMVPTLFVSLVAYGALLSAVLS